MLTLQNGQQLHPKLTYVDSSDKVNGPQTKGTKELGDLLDPLPGYFMVLDPAGKQLYTSTLMRAPLGRRPDAVPPRRVSAHGQDPFFHRERARTTR